MYAVGELLMPLAGTVIVTRQGEVRMRTAHEERAIAIPVPEQLDEEVGAGPSQVPVATTLLVVDSSDDCHVLNSVVTELFVDGIGVSVLVEGRVDVSVVVRVTVDVVVDDPVFVSGGRVPWEESEAVQPQSEVITTVAVTVDGPISASEELTAHSSLPEGAPSSTWLSPRPRTRGEERATTVAMENSLILAAVLRK